MTHLVNCYFEEGTYPTCFKTSIILSIHKKDNLKEMANRRPITLTSSTNKLLENAVLLRLNYFMDKHNIILDTRHGFRPRKSTDTAITAF